MVTFGSCQLIFQVSGLFMRPFQGVSVPYAYDRPLRFYRSQSCRRIPHADFRFRFGSSSLASRRAASTAALAMCMPKKICRISRFYKPVEYCVGDRRIFLQNVIPVRYVSINPSTPCRFNL